jgi:hypothetical protein
VQPPQRLLGCVMAIHSPLNGYQELWILVAWFKNCPTNWMERFQGMGFFCIGEG